MLVAVLVCVPVSEVIVLEIDDDVRLVLSESGRQSELICQSPVRPKTSENLAKIQKHTANKTKKMYKNVSDPSLSTSNSYRETLFPKWLSMK